MRPDNENRTALIHFLRRLPHGKSTWTLGRCSPRFSTSIQEKGESRNCHRIRHNEVKDYPIHDETKECTAWNPYPVAKTKNALSFEEASISENNDLASCGKRRDRQHPYPPAWMQRRLSNDGINAVESSFVGRITQKMSISILWVRQISTVDRVEGWPD